MRAIDADKLLRHFEGDPEDVRIAIRDVIFLINESPTIKLPVNKPKPPRMLPCICGSTRAPWWYDAHSREYFKVCSKCGRKGKPVAHINQLNQAWNEMIMEERNAKPV